MGGHLRYGPKILLTLSRWLVQHGEDLEADLAHYYPRDADQLEAFWRGEMSWRRLWVLVSRLPPESATVAAVVGRERAIWSAQVELLAQVRDLLARANWQFASVHRGKGPPPPEPSPVPRPFTDDHTDPRG